LPTFAIAIGNRLADALIGVRGDRRDLRDRLRILAGLEELLELFGRHGNGLVDTALQIHRLMPAATALRPSRMMACASTVAVVVPSPASSEVFGRHFLHHLRAHVSNLSLSSISLATETPSLVTVERRSSCRALHCGPWDPALP